MVASPFSFAAADSSYLTASVAAQRGLPGPPPGAVPPGGRADGQPAVKRGLRLNTAEAFQGYTLISPLKDTSTYLLDMTGKVVHEWKSDLPPGNSVYLRENGNLLRAARPQNNPRFKGGGEGGRLREYSWDGELLWELDWNDESRLAHHDFEPLPNGNLLLIAWEYKSGEEAVARGRAHWEGEDEFWPDYVVEIKPTGKNGAEVVWEWHTWDHMIQNIDPELPGYGEPYEHPGRVDINGDFSRKQVSAEERKQLEALGYLTPGGAISEPNRKSPDWMHTNGIDYIPEHDLIVLSVRTMNEVWIIDHSTTTAEAATEKGGNFGRGGSILYRWGNPAVYGRGHREERQLFSQHDARWISDGKGGGSLSVFDNGSGREDGKYSLVLELPLDFDRENGFAMDDDGRYLPVKPSWKYEAQPNTSFYSSFISGAERLPNGNTLICEGDDGRVFEVNGDGKIVWEYWNEHGSAEIGNKKSGDGGDSGGARSPRDGRPPRGARPPQGGPPPGGPPPGGPPPGGKQQRRGGPEPKALFRASRIAPDFPGLQQLAGAVAEER